VLTLSWYKHPNQHYVPQSYDAPNLIYNGQLVMLLVVVVVTLLFKKGGRTTCATYWDGMGPS
jgi:hypothetical protein